MIKAEAVNWIINLSADIGKVEHQELWHYEQALSEIRDLLEDEDVVEVVRCKDCKYSHMTFDGECKYCDIWFPMEKTYMDGNYFCASAERRDE